jgi:hypothetical protein
MHLDSRNEKSEIDRTIGRLLRRRASFRAVVEKTAGSRFSLILRFAVVLRKNGLFQRNDPIGTWIAKHETDSIEEQ